MNSSAVEHLKQLAADAAYEVRKAECSIRCKTDTGCMRFDVAEVFLLCFVVCVVAFFFGSVCNPAEEKIKQEKEKKET